MGEENKYTEGLSVPKYGNILDLIYELESSSGQNKNAYKINVKGALGGYQLRAIAIKDIQQEFPEKWGGKSFKEIAMDDDTAREATGDYIKLIGRRLSYRNIAPTEDALLASFHSGMSAVIKNKPLGIEGKNYLKKAQELRWGKQNGND